MKNADKRKDTLFITYLDKYNLYGKPMSEKLIADNFEWDETINCPFRCSVIR